MYVTEDQNDAVLFTYLLKKSINGNTQPLILEGLDPDKNYRVTELNKETKGYSWFTAVGRKGIFGRLSDEIWPSLHDV